MNDWSEAEEVTPSQPDGDRPTPEEIARVQAWQAAREAERKAAADRAHEASERERRAQRDAVAKGLEAPFRGRTITDVGVTIGGYCNDEIQRLWLEFDDGRAVTVESPYGDAELEIEWADADPGFTSSASTSQSGP